MDTGAKNKFIYFENTLDSDSRINFGQGNRVAGGI